MPRLRNRDTGVVVNVSDETAQRLPVTFEAATAKEPVKASAPKKTTKK